MPMMRPKTTAVAAAVLIAAMSLVGCSAGDDQASPRTSSASPSDAAQGDGQSDDTQAGDSSGGNQTVAEACTQLQASIQGVQSDLTSSLGDLQKDPTAAATAINTLADTFSASIDDLRNDEVVAAAKPAGEALSGLADALEQYAADPANADPQALTSSATGLQDSFTGLAQTCS